MAKVALMCVLLGAGLSSCGTSGGWLQSNYTEVDMGGALAGIGQKRAYLPTTGYAGISLWEKGGKYYAMLPMVYAPADYALLTHSRSHGAAPGQKLVSRFPQGLTAEQLARCERHTCFAVLDATQYNELLRLAAQPQANVPVVELKRPFPVVTERDVELSGARCTGTLYGGAGEQGGVVGLLTNRIPARRTWYNRTLQPLSWAAEVLDVPLTAVATPVGWLTALVRTEKIEN